MSKEISLAEVKKHKDRKSLWIVIHNDVYDVTKFLEEHPGGEDTLLDVAGRDGTQEFEDVGHSDDARELLKKYKIGSLPEAECGSDHHILSCHSHTILRPQIAHEPKPERRVQSIVVPQERPRRRTRGSYPNRSTPCPPTHPTPSQSAKLKWLLVALAGAIVIGVVVKKYSSSH